MSSASGRRHENEARGDRSPFPSARFINAVGADRSLSEFSDLMDALCYPTSIAAPEGEGLPLVSGWIERALAQRYYAGLVAR